MLWQRWRQTTKNLLWAIYFDYQTCKWLYFKSLSLVIFLICSFIATISRFHISQHIFLAILWLLAFVMLTLDGLCRLDSHKHHLLTSRIWVRGSTVLRREFQLHNIFHTKRLMFTISCYLLPRRQQSCPCCFSCWCINT